MSFRASLVAGVVASILCSPGTSWATGPAGLARDFGKTVARMLEGARTAAPFAGVVFCVQNRDQCKDTGGPDVVLLDAEHKAELTNVNLSVNRAIRPRNDAPGTDVWSVDVTAGDCEDYALTKRKKLLALGWSSRAIRIAVATTRSGEGHAVLVVRTSEGDLVLDNRFNAIKDWRKTDLRWIMIQAKENPMQWANLVPGGSSGGRDQVLVSDVEQQGGGDIGNY